MLIQNIFILDSEKLKLKKIFIYIEWNYNKKINSTKKEIYFMTLIEKLQSIQKLPVKPIHKGDSITA